MEGQNMLVAVRIRPTAESRKSSPCVATGLTMSVPKNSRTVVSIRDPGPLGRGNNVINHNNSSDLLLATLPTAGGEDHHHSFSFDQVFWCQDSTQEDVYEYVGPRLIKNVLGGFNSCLFAYGQTNSGKTHTMMGPQEICSSTTTGSGATTRLSVQSGGTSSSANSSAASTPRSSTHSSPELQSLHLDPLVNPERGIIPRFAQEVFENISGLETSSQGHTSFRVQFSFVEIYCEKVHDLLLTNSATTGKPQQRQQHSSQARTLKVRQSPTHGPYIEGLTCRTVHDSTDVMRLIVQGMKERATAETRLNERSSRSHALVQLQVTHLDVASGTQKMSKANLVDLAGSERVAQSGAVGERLEEARNINLSLHTLGRVIQALADRSMSSPTTVPSSTPACKSRVSTTAAVGSSSSEMNVTTVLTNPSATIPYRESALTWLLSDSLGGNSKTMMIATVSPAVPCYSQSLTTLRFAGIAQNVINVARVNEEKDPSLQINELRTQVEALTMQLGRVNHRQVSSHHAEDASAEQRLQNLTAELQRKQEQHGALENKLREQKLKEDAERRKQQSLSNQQLADSRKWRIEKTEESNLLKSELAKKTQEIQHLHQVLRSKEAEITAAMASARGGNAGGSFRRNSQVQDAESSATNSQQQREAKQQADVRVSLLQAKLTEAQDSAAKATSSYHKERERRQKAEKIETAKIDSEVERAKESLTKERDEFKRKALRLEQKLLETTATSAKQLEEHQAAFECRVQAAVESQIKGWQKQTSKKEVDESKVQPAAAAASSGDVNLRKRIVQLQAEAVASKTKFQHELRAIKEESRAEVEELELLLLEETEISQRQWLEAKSFKEQSVELMDLALDCFYISIEDREASTKRSSDSLLETKVRMETLAERSLQLRSMELEEGSLRQQILSSEQGEFILECRFFQTTLQHRLSASQERVQLTEESLTAADERVAELTEQLVKVGEQLTATGEKVEELHSVNRKNEKKWKRGEEALQEQVAQLHDNCSQLEQDLAVSALDLERVLDENEEQVVEANEAIVKAEEEAMELGVELSQKTEEVDQLQHEQDELIEEVHHLKNQLAMGEDRALSLESQKQAAIQAAVEEAVEQAKLQAAKAKDERVASLQEQHDKDMGLMRSSSAMELQVALAKAATKHKEELEEAKQEFQRNLDAKSKEHDQLSMTLQEVSSTYEGAVQGVREQLHKTQRDFAEIEEDHSVEILKIREACDSTIRMQRRELEESLAESEHWEMKHRDLALKIDLQESVFDGEKLTLQDSLGYTNSEVEKLRADLRLERESGVKQQGIIQQLQDRVILMEQEKMQIQADAENEVRQRGSTASASVALSPFTPVDCNVTPTTKKSGGRASFKHHHLHVDPQSPSAYSGRGSTVSSVAAGPIWSPTIEHRAQRAKEEAAEQLQDCGRMNDLLRDETSKHREKFEDIQQQLENVVDLLNSAQSPLPGSAKKESSVQ